MAEAGHVIAVAALQVIRLEAILLQRIEPEGDHCDEALLLSTLGSRERQAFEAFVEAMWSAAGDKMRKVGLDQVSLLCSTLLGDATRSAFMPHVGLPERCHADWDDWLSMLLEVSEVFLEEAFDA